MPNFAVMENNTRPLLMLSNDDGVSAKGLRYLIETLAHFGDIIAVAPDGPRSGQSSAITVDQPLRVTRHADWLGARIYSVNGTPADCVKLGLHAIMPRKPDLMLCGVNHGSNAGNSVLYSGTMGAVMEACMVGIPSIGYSLLHHSLDADFTECGPFITDITSRVMNGGLPAGICLNVNIPALVRPAGIKVTRAARGYWTEEYVDRIDPHGVPYWWLTGKFHNSEPDDPETDEYWLKRDYVTVVPVRVDQSAVDKIEDIKRLIDVGQ